MLFTSSSFSADESARNCGDVLVDDVIEMAFADQGQPFTGKVKCYYDKEMEKLKSVRTFNEGIPIGSHHCFERNGNHNYSIIYRNGKRYKKGFIISGEYHEGVCVKNGSSINSCMEASWSKCF